MNWKKILGISFLLYIVGTVFSFLTCGWLFNWVYMIPPLIWNSPEAMFDIGTLIFSNVAGLVFSIIFVWVYAVLYKGIPGEGVKKGIAYGVLLWLVGAVSGMMTMPVYMTISYVVVIYWITQALVLNLIRGAIVGAMYKE